MGGSETIRVGSDLIQGASACQRLIEAIRRHYRRFGGGPSYNELERATGIRRSTVKRALRHLEGEGLIRLRPGVARGIVLVDRAEMLSDTELDLAAKARGAAISWPKPQAIALHDCYRPAPIAHGTDCELSLDDLLAQIDIAEQGVRHGDGEAEVEGGTGA